MATLIGAASAPSAWHFGGLEEAAAGPGPASHSALLLASASGSGTPAAEAALQLNVRAYGLILLGLTLVFAYLWFAADTKAGTWWRGAWYATGLAQAVVAGMLITAAGGETRRKWGPPLGTALLPFAAPLLHVLLLETLLAEPDAGDRRHAWAMWAGRALALITVASAAAAAGLYWRRKRA